mgnify:CR=1 FL=1
MQTGEFVAAFREAFGPVPELPLLFRYTDEPLRPAAKAGGCFFKALAEARDGRPVGLNASNIGCGGGKFYTGFSPMPEFVPQFVSLKERYKQTPEMVLDFIAALDLRPGPKAWTLTPCACAPPARMPSETAWPSILPCWWAIFLTKPAANTTSSPQTLWRRLSCPLRRMCRY